MSKYIKLYGTSILVRGYSRSVICDLQNRQYEFIPNALCEILLKNENLSLDYFCSDINKSENDIFNEYLDFLLERDFVFLTDSPENFPKMDTYWESPSFITNSIIEIDAQSNINNISDFVFQLNDMNCLGIQIRILDKIELGKMLEILDLFNKSEVSSIEIILMQNGFWSMEDIENLIRTYRRITAFYIFNAVEKNIKQYFNVNIFFSDLDFNCGTVQQGVFGSNITAYIEGLHHNSCLNCKISLDKSGNIKHCPNMSCHFGNIENEKLNEIISKPDFTSLWHITKDKIDVCKDCEFRYMCTDCRCFIKDSENVYSQPAKCGYNPYICKWNEQKGYVSVEECGTYSKEHGFVPDHKKIEKLNEEIWK